MGRHKTMYRGPSLTADLGIAPGSRVSLTLGPLNEEGESVTLVDGAPFHVAGGIPGERAEVEVVRVFPERVASRAVKVLTPSPDRVAAPCPYYLECTGCQLQHVTYERQLEFKRERVASELAKWPQLAGARVMPTLASPLTHGYRNHARFTVRKGGAGRKPEGRQPDSSPQRGDVGYVNAVTRRFVKVEHCLLMDPRINAALAAMQGRLQGMSQLSVRVGVNGTHKPEDHAHAQPVMPCGPGLLVQPKLANPDVPLTSGQTHVDLEVLGRRFRVAGSSFFQVNTAQLENVVRLLRKELGLTGRESLVDAYCGVGTFAILLATYVRQATGIEDSTAAVEDARANAAGLGNVEFVLGRAEDIMPKLDAPVDVVILDPPRAGCHPGTLDAVRRLRPRRVALVSCGPAALARDLASLCKDTYALSSVYPVDMFPQTRHVEAVAFLRLDGQ